MREPANVTATARRLPFVDGLRGFALFGVFGANLMIFSGFRVRGLYSGPTGSGPAYDSLAFAAFSNGDYSEVLSANWKYDWFLTNSIGQLGYQLSVFGRLLLGLYAARAFDLGNLDAHRYGYDGSVSGPRSGFGELLPTDKCSP